MFPSDKNNRFRIRTSLIIVPYSILTICLFAYFFHCIVETPSSENIYTIDTFNESNLISSVANLNISTILNEPKLDSYELKLSEFINNAFTTRNDGFLTGDVSNLYDYYRTSNANGKYSLDYEFKRISYLRDWALERSIIFTSINSIVILTNVSIKDNKAIVNLEEHSTFNYIHNKNSTVNKFSLTIPHILTIYTDNTNSVDYFFIDKDYYCDIFNDSLDSYIFNLTETFLPYTKRINPSYEISKDFKEDDILRFEKLFFTDHKAIISGYDSNGYPLVDSNLLGITNMPFDLGWKQKYIKLSY